MTTQTLDIRLLGTFDIRYGESQLAETFPARFQYLLAYLLLHRDVPQPRQQLAFLIWPDATEERARASLRNLLYLLRKKLPESHRFLYFEGQVVQWQADAPFTLDVAEWDLALLQAEQARDVGDQAAERAALERAAALYRGDLLPGCYDDWILPQRERLHQAFLEVLHRLTSLLEAAQDYDAALASAQRLLRTDLLHEPGCRALMRLHALTGNRAVALQVYRAFVAALQRELGVEPEPETTTLYEQIQAGAELPPHFAAPAHNLPAEFTPFVGRKALLNGIVAQLQDTDCRLLTLVGPGGSGKTRLARQAAKSFLSIGADTLFEDGLFFVPLAPLSSSDGIVPTIGSAIGFSFYEGGTPKQQLLDYLRQKHMLIILDNLEHLLAPPRPLRGPRIDTHAQDRLPEDSSALPPPAPRTPSLVRELLHAAPGLKIVATSRTRLNVQGEHLLHIEGLHYPESKPGLESEPDQYSAVQLFLACAREIRPDLLLTTDDLAQVARICQLVEGMPLALRLAAAWMEMLTPAEIMHELESKAAQAIDFLASNWQDVPERQRSMRAVFDHSWSLLGERERALFRSLSVFRGGFTREAAEQVAGASLRELIGLVNKSLLQRDASSRGGRYELHELLRQYAEKQLVRSADAGEAVRAQHAAYYAGALARWAADLTSERLPVALTEIDAEIENARVAWSRAAEHGQVALLDQAMEGLNQFYLHRGRHQEGEAAFRNATERLTAIREQSAGLESSRTSPALTRVLVRTLAVQSIFLREQGHREHARQHLERAQALLEGPDLVGQDVRRERALVLSETGHLENRYNLDRAIQLLEQSLALHQEIGIEWRIGMNLRLLGSIYGRLGQYDKGRQAIKESMAIYQALGSPLGRARGAWYLSGLHRQQGQLERAEQRARESLSIYRTLGIKIGTALALGQLGFTLMYRGEYIKAQSLVQECQTILSDLGARRGTRWAWVFATLGAIELHQGHYGQARTLAEKGLAIVQSPDQTFMIWCLHVVGPATLVQGAITEARQWLDKNIALCRKEKTQNRLGLAHAYLGYVSHQEGAADQAWHHACRALQIGAALEDPRPGTRALPLLALLLADRGEVARAVELYALASRHPAVANSRWFEDVAGKHLAAAAAALTPAAVAAAQERGRARDLATTVEELLADLDA